jgi:hypothetical protein
MSNEHPLATESFQELFNRAYLGMAEQGFEQSYSIEAVCRYTVYRGSKVLHCAIGQICKGHKMPTEYTSPHYPDFWSSLGVGPAQRGEDWGSRVEFLSQMQLAHDSDGHLVKENMEEFAAKHGLTVPEIPA